MSAVDPYAVVGYLAAAGTIDRAAERLEPASLRGLQPLSAIDAVKAVVAHAADLTRGSRLLPPAEAAFLENQGLKETELEAVRSDSLALLQSYVDEKDGGGADAEPGAEETRRVALAYAGALLKQERALEVLEEARASAPSLDGALTGTDRMRVGEFLLYWSLRGPYITTLAIEMKRWRTLVQSTDGSASPLMFEEYENFLPSRDRIEDALSLVTPGARKALQSQLVGLDERFLGATRALPKPIRPRSPWRPQRWWWYRIPSALGERFSKAEAG